MSRLCIVVSEFRSLLDHVATAIADLGGIKSGFGNFDRRFGSNSRSGNRSRSNGSGRSFNRDTRCERTTGFCSGGFGSSGSCFGGNGGSRSFGIVEFTTRAIRTAFTAVTARTTVLTLFVAVTVLTLLGLTVLFTAVFFILTILIAIVLVVAFPTLGHFLGANGATGIRLQVHVRGELFNNRGMEIVENLANLREDNDAQDHCNE